MTRLRSFDCCGISSAALEMFGALGKRPRIESIDERSASLLRIVAIGKAARGLLLPAATTDRSSPTVSPAADSEPRDRPAVAPRRLLPMGHDPASFGSALPRAPVCGRCDESGSKLALFPFFGGSLVPELFRVDPPSDTLPRTVGPWPLESPLGESVSVVADEEAAAGPRGCLRRRAAFTFPLTSVKAAPGGASTADAAAPDSSVADSDAAFPAAAVWAEATVAAADAFAPPAPAVGVTSTPKEVPTGTLFLGTNNSGDVVPLRFASAAATTAQAPSPLQLLCPVVMCRARSSGRAPSKLRLMVAALTCDAL